MPNIYALHYYKSSYSVTRPYLRVVAAYDVTKYQYFLDGDVIYLMPSACRDRKARVVLCFTARKNQANEGEETQVPVFDPGESLSVEKESHNGRKSSASTDSDTTMDDTTLTVGKASSFSLKQCLRAC